GAADAFFLAGQVEFVNRTVGRGKGPGLDAAADALEVRIGFLERVFRFGGKPEILQPVQGQLPAKIADGPAQRGPFAAGAFEQAYFVFGEEDEIAVRICSETALRCRRAEASERFQSSLVMVLKSASFGRAGELAPAEESGLAGEGVLHGSAMRATSARPGDLAKGFCRQLIRKPRTRGRATNASRPQERQGRLRSGGEAKRDQAMACSAAAVVGGVTLTLSTRCRSMSITSKRQPSQVKWSPALGMRPNCVITKPPR